MATKTVTRYRTRVVARRRSRRGVLGGRKLSLLVVAGLLPGVAWSLWPGISGNNWKHSFERGIAAYTGYYVPEQRFRLDLMANGALPLIAGFLLHALAKRMGFNRIFGSLPVEL